MDLSGGSARLTGVHGLIPYALIPFALGCVAFDPGLTGVDGLSVRISLGLLWVFSGSITACLTVVCLINSQTSQRLKRRSISTLVGHGLVVPYIVLYVMLIIPTEGRITSMMKNNIPVGSGKTQVKAFLDSRKIKYESYQYGIRAGIPDGILQLSDSFDVYFYFDKKDKMTSFEVIRPYEEYD